MKKKTHELADFLPYLPEDIKLTPWQKAKLIKAYPEMEGISLATVLAVATAISCGEATAQNIKTAEMLLRAVQEQLGITVQPMKVSV